MTKESAFTYQNGFLCADVVPLKEIAEEHGTPLLVISERKSRENANILMAHYKTFGISPYYSVRADDIPLIIRTLFDTGYILKVSTIEELYRLLNADVPPSNIYAAGLGKSADYITAALLANVNLVEVSTLAEVKVLAEIATSLGKKCNISIKLDFEHGEQKQHQGLHIDNLADCIGYLLQHQSLNLKGLCLSNSPLTLSYDKACASLDTLSAIFTLLRTNGLHPTIIDINDIIDNTTNQLLRHELLAVAHSSFALFPDVFVVAAGQNINTNVCAFLTKVCHIETTGGQKLIFVDVDEDIAITLKTNTPDITIMPLFSAQQEPTVQTLPTSIIAGNTLMVHNAVSIDDVQEGSILAITPSGPLYSGGNTNCVIVSGANHALVRRRMSEIERMTYETAPDWMEADRVA